jgi:hypothetical protein
MSERPVVDRRHPSWCNLTRCEADNEQILGDHRSRVMEVRPREPYDERVSLWLLQPVHDSLAETKPWIFLRFEDRRVNGEVDSVATYSLRLDEAEDLSEALATVVELARRATLVDEDEWRQRPDASGEDIQS